MGLMSFHGISWKLKLIQTFSGVLIMLKINPIHQKAKNSPIRITIADFFIFDLSTS
jgi:hypothetical protein